MKWVIFATFYFVLTAAQRNHMDMTSFRNVLHWSRSSGGIVRPTALFTHLRFCGTSLCTSSPAENAPEWVSARSATEATSLVLSLSISDNPDSTGSNESFEFVGMESTAWIENGIRAPNRTHWGTANWWSDDSGSSTAFVVGRCTEQVKCKCGEQKERPLVFKFLEWKLLFAIPMLQNTESEIRDATVIFDDGFRAAQLGLLVRDSCSVKVPTATHTAFLPSQEGLCDGCVDDNWIDCPTNLEWEIFLLEPSPSHCDTLVALPVNNDEIIYLYTKILATSEQQTREFGIVYRPNGPPVRVQKFRRYKRIKHSLNEDVVPATYVALTSLTGDPVGPPQRFPIGPDAADLVAAWKEKKLLAVGVWESRALFHGNWTGADSPSWWNGITLVRQIQWTGNSFLQLPLDEYNYSKIDNNVLLIAGQTKLCHTADALGRMAFVWDIQLSSPDRPVGIRMIIGKNELTGVVSILYDAEDGTLIVDRGMISLNIEPMRIMPHVKVLDNLKGDNSLTRLVVAIDRTLIEVFAADEIGFQASAVVSYSLRTPKVDVCIEGFHRTASDAMLRVHSRITEFSVRNDALRLTPRFLIFCLVVFALFLN